MSATPNFIATIRNAGVSIANADGTTDKVVLAAGAQGTRIDGFFAVTNSPSAILLYLGIRISGVTYVIGAVNVPAGAGGAVLPSVNLLNPVAIPGLNNTENGALYLQSGASLTLAASTAVPGASTVQIMAMGGDY